MLLYQLFDAGTAETAHIPQRNRAAHRKAHEGETIKAERLHYAVHVVRHTVIMIAGDRRIRAAEAAQVERHHPIAEPGEQLDLVLIHEMRKRPAVYQQHRDWNPGVPIVNVNTAAAIGCYVKHDTGILSVQK